MYWKHFKEDKNAPSLGMLQKTLYQCKYYQFHIGIVTRQNGTYFSREAEFFCLCHLLHSLGDVKVIQYFSRNGQTIK